MSGNSSTGFGAGVGGGGVNFGEAAARAAATSLETARFRLGALSVGAVFSGALGFRIGEAAGVDGAGAADCATTAVAVKDTEIAAAHTKLR
jgi:hypothetical protein